MVVSGSAEGGGQSSTRCIDLESDNEYGLPLVTKVDTSCDFGN